MSLRRIVPAAAILLTLGAIAPVAAVADPVSVASCGTSAAMWTGSYEGNLVFDASPGDPRRLRVDITSSGSGLAAHTVLNDDQNPYHPSGEPTIQNGNLVWTAWFYALPFAFYDTYTTNSVTCSGAKVTTFGGEVPFEVKWIGPFAEVDPMNESDKTFSLSRTS
jgi:hypothetical protein